MTAQPTCAVAPSTEELDAVAHRIRLRVARMCAGPEGGHLGGALSVTDILTVLYFGTLRLGLATAADADRDIVILSKGHAGLALYATLAECGLLDEEHTDAYGHPGTLLGGHPSPNVPGVEVATGSLGHGPALGAGFALARQLQGRPGRVIVIVGDGELQEGSVWEAILLAGARRLTNLTVIVDRNGYQQSAAVDQVTDIPGLAQAWEAVGWAVCRVDGHDVAALVSAVNATAPPVDGSAIGDDEMSGRPRLIVADTVKARGVNFLEHSVSGHYVQLSEHNLARAIRSIDRTRTSLRPGAPVKARAVAPVRPSPPVRLIAQTPPAAPVAPPPGGVT